MILFACFDILNSILKANCIFRECWAGARRVCWDIDTKFCAGALFFDNVMEILV